MKADNPLREPALLPYWDLFLGEWSRAGAWYGLHGDTPLGCLAALNSLAKLRGRLAKAQIRIPGAEMEYPGGALASAKYSIAKRLYLKSDRTARFREALSDLQRSLNAPNPNEAALRAIRGIIFLRLGRTSAAIDKYEYVLKVRIHSHAPASTIGEALANWDLVTFAMDDYLEQSNCAKKGLSS